jgi:hypothetical protein
VFGIAGSIRSIFLPAKELKLRHMYEAMDMFHAHAAEVEETVFFHTANLFNLEVDLIFYDTTTASFTTDYEDDVDDRMFPFVSSVTPKKEPGAPRLWWLWPSPAKASRFAVGCFRATPPM